MSESERQRPSEEEIRRLLIEARKGTTKAFLSKPGSGTAYGAAVLTAGGRIFSAGQYSSFNHITNIHAEMAAVLMATMSGEPEIVALALVSTGAAREAARMCGVCREFLNEHMQRTGLADLTVIRASFDGEVVEQESYQELLPNRWSANKGKKVEVSAPWYPLGAATLGRELSFGDMVQVSGSYLAMVWEPTFFSGQLLAKAKYRLVPSEALGKHRFEKFSHSFHEYEEYLRELSASGLSRLLPWGASACLVKDSEIEGVRYRVPLYAFGLRSMRPFTRCLDEAGIRTSAVWLTGSTSVGLNRADSDLDIVIEANPEQIRSLREAICLRLSDGRFFLPSHSGTLDQLIRVFNEGMPFLIKEGRFAETFSFMMPELEAAKKLSLIYVRPEDQFSLEGSENTFFHKTFFGARVVNVEESVYKRACYWVELEGKVWEVYCWHKWASLLKAGDIVDLSGFVCENKVYQLNSETEWLRWKQKACF